MLIVRIVAAALLGAIAAPASAQSAFGDAQLSYSGGVVYDDDLVPGRGPDQPYLADEPPGAGAYADAAPAQSAARDASGRRLRINSPDLVGGTRRTLR